MSFFDTLKAMGLFPNQPQAPVGQPAAAPAQTDPYGLDPETRRMLGFQTLGNVSQQLLALGQQMTPAQRAQMIPNLDFSGGAQQNMYNAAQMKLAQRKMQQEDMSFQQAQAARQQLADKIKATPPGRLRDAAMFYLQAGDLPKAGELLFSSNRLFDASTGQYIYVDAMGNPVDGPSSGGSSLPVPSTGAGGKPGKGGVAPLSAGGGRSGAPAAPGGVRPMPPANGASGDVAPLTRTWRALTQDPTLTDAEAQQIAVEAGTKNDPAAGLALYRQMRQQQQQADQQKAQLEQTGLNNKVTAAEQLTSKYDEALKPINKIISNGQMAINVVNRTEMTAPQKLLVLYKFMNDADPDGSVRDSDVNLGQSMQGLTDRIAQALKSVNGGGTISDNVVKQMAGEMADLANQAAGAKERLRIQMIGRANGRKIPTDMVAPDFTGGSQNIPLPIGYNAQGTGFIQPRRDGSLPGPAADGPSVTLHPEDQSLFNRYFGG